MQQLARLPWNTGGSGRDHPSTGLLLAAVDVTGRTSEELARASTWGEPPDYFDHVMFANGRCTAPEAVARSRSMGRDIEPLDLLQ